MDLGSLGIVCALVFGLVLGSFLNVCIYRVPIKKSIAFPASHCPQCSEKIRFYDNIPVLSYAILGGKCRKCRTPIPIRYPLVELITSLLSTALFLRYGVSVQFFLYLAFSASLVVITFIDIQHKIIPDVISIPGIIVGLIISFFGFTGLQWHESLVGMVAGGGCLFLVGILFEWITGKEGMGGGDVKLLAMIGAWMGWKGLPYIVLMSSLAGALIGGISLIVARSGMRTKIPFGPFLSLGALVQFFFGNELIAWYVRNIL